jgi:hypothetical protein
MEERYFKFLNDVKVFKNLLIMNLFILDDINIQIMYADGNFSVLTFCDDEVLFSLGLMSTNITAHNKSHEELYFTEHLFKQAYLGVEIEGIRIFAGANWNFINLFIFLLVFINILF